MSLSAVQHKTTAPGHAIFDLMQWNPTQTAIPANAFRLSCEGAPREAAARMLDEGFRPPGRKDLLPWRLDSPIDWQADPFNDRNWRFQLHAWRMLDCLLLAYQDAEDDTYLTKALDFVREWYIHHVEHGHSGPFSWYDMSVGVRSMRLTYLLDLILHGRCADYASDVPMLVVLWHLHVGELTNPNALSRGNHGLFQLQGLLALTYLFPTYSLSKSAKAYGIDKMKRLIRSQLGEHGIHEEDSPEYHFFVCSILENMLRAPWYDRGEFGFAFDLLDKAIENKQWLVLPNNRMIPVGDSGNGPARQGYRPKRELHNRDTFENVSRRLSNGYGVVRSEWNAPSDKSSMLFVMAAFNATAHKHADDLSFVWFDHGQDILVDSGKYGYDRNAWRNYVQSTRAHNTIEIDGLSYPIKREYAYGSALRRVEPAGDLWLVEAAVQHRLHGVRHQRVVLFKPLEFLIVLDRLVGEKEHGFCSWFHFSPKIEVAAGPGDGPALTASLADGRRVLAWHASSAGGVESQLVRGQETPQIQGWRSCGYKKMEPAWTAGFASRGREVLLASAFMIAEVGAQANLQLALSGAEKAGVVLDPGGVASELVVRFTTDGAELVPSG